MQIPQPKARWTQAHLAELERMFPEKTQAGASEQLNFNLGARSVVHYVRRCVQEAKDEMV